jgi:dihydropteroate synthase
VTLTPLASRDPISLRDALVRRGVDESRAIAVAQGLRPIALILETPNQDGQEALAEAARLAGVDCLSGEGWVLVSGSAARVAGMTRAAAEAIPTTLTDEIGTYLASSQEVPLAWMTARGSVGLDGPVVVGILNITPDSFSDGGECLEPEAALRRADEMLDAGADMLDVGAESSRPGRPESVSVAEEWGRLAPVLTELVRRHPSVPISVDTVKSETAELALDNGAWVVNDVSGLRLDPQIASVCAERGAGLVLMHSRGSFSDMATYNHASYHDVVAEMVHELTRSLDRALASGVRRDSIAVDPGIGFSKDPSQSFAAINGIPALASLGYPVMIGPSRKRLLGAVTGRDVTKRDESTAHLCVAAFVLGAALFRVHAVGQVKQALKVAAAIRSN